MQRTDERDEQAAPADNPSRVVFGYVGATGCDHNDKRYRKSDEQEPPYCGANPVLNFGALLLLLRIGGHDHFLR